MKKPLNLLLIFSLFLLFLSCSTAPKKASNKVFLWKAQNNGTTVYLLGSIHVAKKEMYPLDSTIEQAFKYSNVLYCELNSTEIDPVKLKDVAYFKDTVTLKSKLTEANYLKLKNKFKANRVPEFMFRKFKPWVAAMYVMMMELKDQGFDADYGIDNYFLKKSDGKTVSQLETLDEQVSVFESDTSFAAQNAVVEMLLSDESSSNDEMSKIFDAWKLGDGDAVSDFINKGLSENTNFEKKILTDRNKKMSDKILKFFGTDKTYFVIVGSAHLVGNDGVVSLLKNHGIKVEQMNKKNSE